MSFFRYSFLLHVWYSQTYQRDGRDYVEFQTERLVLRPYTLDDYDNWLSQFKSRLPAQHKYDDGRPINISSFTKSWYRNWINGFQKLAQKDEMYILGVFRKSDGVNVGKVELITLLRMDYHWATMGYSIHNQHWRNGYGTESVTGATKLFFDRLNFHRIELHINVDNIPSIRLAEKAGFTFECVREKFSYENNRWNDFLIYYKNRSY